MTDVDAEHVKNYAATHAGSNSDHEDPLEAGDDIAPAAGNEPAEPMDASAETRKRAEADSPILPGSPKKQRVGDDQPVTPKDDLMDAAGERAPKTPRLEDYPHQQRMLQVTSTDLDMFQMCAFVNSFAATSFFRDGETRSRVFNFYRQRLSPIYLG